MSFKEFQMLPSGPLMGRVHFGHGIVSESGGSKVVVVALHHLHLKV